MVICFSCLCLGRTVSSLKLESYSSLFPTRGPVHEICALEVGVPLSLVCPPHILGAIRGCPTDSLCLIPVGSEPKPQSGLPLWETTGLIRERHQLHHPAAAATAGHHSHQDVFINMNSGPFTMKK